ncbi:MAG: AraC family transcriptional regulator [Christensenellales bacterium]|jgi:AraC-like DNA-binding protein
MKKLFFNDPQQNNASNIRLPNIRSLIVNAGPLKVAQSPHIHRYPEIGYFYNFNGTHTINGKTYQVGGDSLVILNGGVIHSEISVDEQYCAYSIVLDDLLLTDLPKNAIISDIRCPVVPCGKYANEIRNVFLENLTIRESREEYYYELIQYNVAKILYYITQLLPHSMVAPNHTVSATTLEIQKFIDHHYNTRITLDSLSKQFYMSAFHIVHLLTKEIGISPINYLISRRIGESQRYLMHSGKSISEIALLVGYENVNHFSNMFSKRIGMFPGEYRKLMHASKTDNFEMH